MPSSLFEELCAAVAQGPQAALERLCARLREEKRYQDLFDARLMQIRHRLGLPVILTSSLDQVDEPLRSQVENAYLEACREVGHLLLAEGRVRDAWTYLRMTGDKQPVAQALEGLQPDEETLDELIEVAVHEGVAPRRGFEWVLEHFGLCNAITMFDGTMYDRPRADQQQVAALLIRRVHGELLENLRAEVARQEGARPPETSIADLIAERDWLFLDDAYHIDTSHLHSVVRFARVVEEAEPLRLAVELCTYGQRLSPQFQFQTEEPFAECYAAHLRFFRAQLDPQAQQDVDYFRAKAESLPVGEYGTGPAEVYVALLARLQRYGEAMEAAARLIPPRVRTSGFAPSLLELARLSGRYDRLMEISQQRDDVLWFAAGLVEKTLQNSAPQASTR
jgi:hypothetical protein